MGWHQQTLAKFPKIRAQENNVEVAAKAAQAVRRMSLAVKSGGGGPPGAAGPGGPPGKELRTQGSGNGLMRSESGGLMRSGSGLGDSPRSPSLNSPVESPSLSKAGKALLRAASKDMTVDGKKNSASSLGAAAVGTLGTHAKAGQQTPML